MPEAASIDQDTTSSVSSKSLFPDGHFYSPVADRQSLIERRAELWPATPRPLAGINLEDARHLEVLEQWFPQYIGEYDYPDLGDSSKPAGFFSFNDQFAWLDARALFVFLRHLKPRRVIEIGSGFSSLLIADVNRRFLSGQCEFTCIEPYPRQFLKDGIAGVTRLIERRVELVDPAVFDELAAGDILFIDSSHVAKTGSDVLFLFLEVLPKLRKGVIVHIHDIFLPFEYPQAWAIDENRSWNEQYLLQALLMFSTRFRVLFGCSYAAGCHGHAVVKALARPDGHGMGGGSFWIEVV